MIFIIFITLYFLKIQHLVDLSKQNELRYNPRHYPRYFLHPRTSLQDKTACNIYKNNLMNHPKKLCGPCTEKPFFGFFEHLEETWLRGVWNGAHGKPPHTEQIMIQPACYQLTDETCSRLRGLLKYGSGSS
jgi:hypothetical protein